MKTKIMLIITLILVILSGCQTKTEETTKVGAILPLTGPASFLGGLMYDGMALADEQIQSLDVIYEDCAGDQKLAISAFQMLTEFKEVDALVTVLTPVAEVIAPLAQEKQVPLLLTSVSVDDVEDGRDFVFRDFTSAKQDASISGEFAKEELKAETAAIIYILTDFGKSYADYFEEAFDGEVKHFTFEMPDKDFRTQLAQVKALDYEVLYVIGYDKHIISIIKQAKELQIDTTFMTGWVVASPIVVETAKDIVEDVYITTPEFYFDDREEIKQFKEDFHKKYGYSPDAYAAMGYDTVMILAHAGKDIQKGLSEISGYESLMGIMTVDEDGGMSFPLKMAKLIDGQVVVIE
jgi:branched-chain amino acid transport system substrate-binding protein